MQPNANINPLAEVTKFAPKHNAQATSAGVTNLPDEITFTLSYNPYCLSLLTKIGKLSFKGKPISSSNGIGAAPVPPSALSTVIKSGAYIFPR